MDFIISGFSSNILINLNQLSCHFECIGKCLLNKMPAKAFTPPSKTKMIIRPGRAVTRTFAGGVVYQNQCLSDLPGTLPRVLVGLHF